MANKKHHHKGLWLINLLLALAAGLAWWVVQHRNTEIASPLDVSDISYVLQGEADVRYVGADSPLDLFEEELFAGGTSVKRAYTLESKGDHPQQGRLFWLLLVQTFQDRHAHHPPEYCYTGSGWEIAQSKGASWTLPDLQVSGSEPTREEHRPIQALARLTTPGHIPRQELISYWFTDGVRFAPSYMDRTIADTLDQLSGNRHSWVMVRLSTPLEGKFADPVAAEKALQAFSKAVQAALIKP